MVSPQASVGAKRTASPALAGRAREEKYLFFDYISLTQTKNPRNGDF